MYRSSSKQAGAKASFTSTKHKSEQAGSSIDAIVYCVQAKHSTLVIFKNLLLDFGFLFYF
jgi:hypothetical protein